MTRDRAFDIPEHLLPPAERARRRPEWILVTTVEGRDLRLRVDAIAGYMQDEKAQGVYRIWVRGDSVDVVSEGRWRFHP